MSSLNKVMLIGRLGKDPEVRYTQGGDAVANITLATSESWKDKSGTKQEKTEWHKVVVFGKLAEICAEYLKKGQLTYFEGSLQTRKWQDKEGNDKYTTEIKVDSFSGKMQMLGGKKDEENEDADPPARATAAKTKADAQVDDDIPF